MGYYSFNQPRRDGRLSWPCWLTDSGCLTHKVVTWPAIGLAQDTESSPARTGGLAGQDRWSYHYATPPTEPTKNWTDWNLVPKWYLRHLWNGCYTISGRDSLPYKWTPKKWHHQILVAEVDLYQTVIKHRGFLATGTYRVGQKTDHFWMLITFSSDELEMCLIYHFAAKIV